MATEFRSPELHIAFEAIARDILWIDTLETRHDLALDEHTVSVDRVREALWQAYHLGRQHAADTFGQGVQG